MMSQINVIPDPDIRNVTYNAFQLAFTLAFQKKKVAEAARGVGKSTLFGRQIYDHVIQMPRSTGVMVGQSFAQIKTRTLPSTIAGLEQHGLIKDIHFFVGRRAHASWNWPEAYEPPLDYDNSIHFFNGTVLIFVSQDGSASSGRGLNVDWVMADEAALLDEEKFHTDVLATNRGGKFKIAVYPDGTTKYFHECSLHHSVTLMTSTPLTASGRWIFKYEQQAILHPSEVLYLRAPSFVNIDNLGIEWFKNLKATMPAFLYDAEIKNIRINQVENGFYPALNESKHLYIAHDNQYFKSLQDNDSINCDGDADIIDDLPLTIGIDWGAHINCMVITQRIGNTVRFLKNMYVKHPLIIDDLIDDFINYYKPHKNKHVNIWYDPSGNNRQANTRKTYAQQVELRLHRAGWSCQLLTHWNDQQSHELKFKLWNNLLREDDATLPIIRMNKYNCKELWISMTLAPAKQGTRVAIQKDKSSEKKKGMAQEHATHFSDAADVIIVGQFLHTLDGLSVDMPANETR